MSKDNQHVYSRIATILKASSDEDLEEVGKAISYLISTKILRIEFKKKVFLLRLGEWKR